MQKSPDAFRTISEVAAWLETPAHVLRFWESRFPDLKPVQRAGGRRYYRPQDMLLLGGIKHLLHTEGHTIKSVQDRIKADGTEAVAAFSPPLGPPPPRPAEDDAAADGPGAPAIRAEPHELVGADGGGAADAPAPIIPARDDPAPSPAGDDDAPPIGFFFDDSDDAAPAAVQSGTFAQPLAPDAPAAPPPAAPAAPEALPETPPPGPRLGTLPPMPDDPADDAPGHAPPLPLTARLRALRAADIPPAHVATLTGLYRRLEGKARAAD